MGGHPEGEVASQLALQTLAAAFQREAKPALKNPIRFLQEAILSGHHQLLRYATERALVDTPRTTVVACVLQGKSAYWAHCGDSRLYLVRKGQLHARTRDHSYIELQESLSHVVPIDARFNRSVLFTCMGSPGKPVVDTVGPVPLLPGDRIIVCSDGLWSSVSDEVIVEMLTDRPLQDAVPKVLPIRIAPELDVQRQTLLVQAQVTAEDGMHDVGRRVIEARGFPQVRVDAQAHPIVLADAAAHDAADVDGKLGAWLLRVHDQIGRAHV